MKLDTTLVRAFEADQQAHGTETAIYNLMWKQACELLQDAGVTSIKTRMKSLRA